MGVLHQEPYAHSADLYSFGVMIWMLLTGGSPEFDGPPRSAAIGGRFEELRTDYQLLHTIIQMPEAHHVRPLPSPEAADLVLGLTQRLPAARPNHSDILAHALLQVP